ncbi:MAG: DUF1634 domain-containing protein [Streptococcaceae bacterium]|nr:DUF1634 domain-containing protein [Streptococcaceae bacterium]
MSHVEKFIARLLQIGVLISMSIMTFGLLLFFVTGRSGYSGDKYPLILREIWLGTLEMKPFAIMMLGLFCLILTPVLRVIASIFAFLFEKDYLYVAITLLVLLILLTAMFVGLNF